MAKSYSEDVNPGLFIPTTSVFDIELMRKADVNSHEFKELLVRLYQNVNNIALALNQKDSGLYYQEEFVTGQVYFPNPSLSSTTQQQPTPRPVFRKVINFGSLPNTGSTSVAHGLTVTANFSFTRIYGAATDPSTSFIPLPYASPTDADNIELSVDATNVTITTGSDRTGYTTCYVVLEYLKQ